jgi:hypothetical protein
MPTFQGRAQMTGVPNVAGSLPAVRNFADGTAPYFELASVITGVTRDSTGAALGSCPLVLFRTADNSIAALTTSDASGAYRIEASPALTHYLVAYKAGAPDVAGTTVNTLVGI